MSTVIITGSRNWSCYDTLARSLDTEHVNNLITLLVEGGARGADHLAAVWAKKNNIRIETVLADWTTYGKSAGPRRNVEMLNRFPEARVIAFPLADSIGSIRCMEQALKRKMKVTNYGCRAFINGKEV